MKRTKKFDIPDYPMKCKLVTPYKIKNLWACYDGDDKIEVFFDIEESHWQATVDLNTKIVCYYYTKFSVCPKVSAYKLLIPEIKMEFKQFTTQKVDWERI